MGSAMQRKTWLLPLPLSALASRKRLARVTRLLPETISRPAPIAALATPRAQTAGNAAGTRSCRAVSSTMLAILGGSNPTGNDAGGHSSSIAGCASSVLSAGWWAVASELDDDD